MILSERDVPKIKQYMGQGLTYVDITNILNAEGYTKISGKKICPSSISKIMVDSGLRLKSIRKNKVVNNQGIDQVKELIDSNLSEPLKKKLLKSMIDLF